MDDHIPRRRPQRLFQTAAVAARILTGSVAVGAVWTVLIGHAEARTEPFEGVGSAPLRQGTAARKEALRRARDAALRAAIESLVQATDPAAKARVLERMDGWTGAYRILEEREVGQDVEVRVEVEVDLARLRKQLSTDVQRKARGFRFGGARIDASSGGCGGLDEARVEAMLGHDGVLAGERTTAHAPTLALDIRCEPGGAIPFTFVHAGKFNVTATVDGTAAESVHAFGYADDPGAAIAAAVDDGLSQLSERLSARARGGVMVRIESPWPSSRVRQLQTRIEQALVGVEHADLDGIEPGGVVRLHLDTDLDAAVLEPRLRTLDLTGFQLHGIRVDSAHALTVRLD